jgi:hypothetical protein
MGLGPAQGDEKRLLFSKYCRWKLADGRCLFAELLFRSTLTVHN